MPVDFSKWDPRSRELTKKHPIPEERFAAWEKNYQHSKRAIEIGYLLHVANDLYNRAYEIYNSVQLYGEEVGEREKSVKFFEGAKKVYEVAYDITGKLNDSFSAERIKVCDTLIEKMKK